MEPHMHGQHEDGSEPWAVHRASQSPQALTQGQVNVMIVAVFSSSFVLNYLMDASPQQGTAQVARVEGWVVGFVVCIMALVWGVLLFKIRECAVWPEQVRFRRDGLIEVELACGTKRLNPAHGAVTLLRRRVHWRDSLGVFCNAITDKTRDEVFVMVPTEGPRYWYGFAFQPEDTSGFLNDCAHAGVLMTMGGVDAELGMVQSEQERTQRSLRTGLLSEAMRRDAHGLVVSGRLGSFSSSESSDDDHEEGHDDEDGARVGVVDQNGYHEEQQALRLPAEEGDNDDELDGDKDDLIPGTNTNIIEV